MNIADTMTALAAAAGAMDGIVGEFNYPVRSAEPPFVTATPAEIVPRIVYGIHPRLNATVRTLVGRPDEEGAAVNLYAYIDAVTEAIEADRTLGGLVDDLQVVSINEPQIFEYGQVELIGFETTVDIIASA